MEFIRACEYLEKLASTTSKLEKIQIGKEMIRSAKNDEELRAIILFLQGKQFPDYSNKETGVSSNLIIKAIVKAYGYDEQEIEKKWKEKGDLGLVSEELAQTKKQAILLTQKLSLLYVLNTLQKLASLEGEGSVDKKMATIAGLLINAKPIEAKYITRWILGDLRIGVAEGIIRESIVAAFFVQVFWQDLFTSVSSDNLINIALKYWRGAKLIIGREVILSNPHINLIRKIATNVRIIKEEEIEKIESFHYSVLNSDIIIVSNSECGNGVREMLSKLVEMAYSLINDMPEVAVIAKNKGEKGLKEVKPILFRPIRVMLAQKVPSIEEAFKALGKVLAWEYKFDGFRTQIHKKGNKVRIFTRRLEDVTKQFPDVVQAVKECVKCRECIIEGETISYDKETGKWLPFQKISKRIKRKYNVHEMAEQIPVITFLFDIVYLEGKKTIDLKFKERRKLLESIIQEKDKKMMLAKQLISDNPEDARKFYDEALSLGNEGVMAKNLEANYEPGLRVGHMLKIKPTLENLDLTIIAAEWGEGKRSGMFSSFELACLDRDTGEFLTIGKLGTGIKEKVEAGGVTFEELTEMLKPNVLKEEGKKVYVKPTVVIEVAYEEIQKSPKYSSGFALRFPRLVRIRDDKSIEEIDDLDRITRIYNIQRSRIKQEIM